MDTKPHWLRSPPIRNRLASCLRDWSFEINPEVKESPRPSEKVEKLVLVSYHGPASNDYYFLITWAFCNTKNRVRVPPSCVLWQRWGKEHIVENTSNVIFYFTFESSVSKERFINTKIDKWLLKGSRKIKSNGDYSKSHDSGPPPHNNLENGSRLAPEFYLKH